MKRVTGIGGIFFKAKDAPALQAWYKRHLGIDVQEWGGTAFTWADSDGKPTGGTTIWSVGPKEGDQFLMKRWLYVTGPSTKKVAGLRKSIARGETALRAPTRKPGGGTR
jgi:hypothetical protein